jgi:hypothetical protein
MMEKSRSSEIYGRMRLLVFSYNSPDLIAAFRYGLKLAKRLTVLDIAMCATGALTQPDADENDEDCANLHRVKCLIEQ